MVDLGGCSRECSRREGGRSQALKGRLAVVVVADQEVVDRLGLARADYWDRVVGIRYRERGNG